MRRRVQHSKNVLESQIRESRILRLMEFVASAPVNLDSECGEWAGVQPEPEIADSNDVLPLIESDAVPDAIGEFKAEVIRAVLEYIRKAERLALLRAMHAARRESGFSLAPADPVDF